MPFPHTILLGSVVVTINLLVPLVGWAEVSPFPHGLPSKSLTLNYSLATQDGHHHSPQILNTQSSNSVLAQVDEQKSSSPPSVIEPEVSSYIIHEPALRHQEEEASQPALNPASPASDEQQINEKESTVAPHHLAYTIIEHPPLILSEEDRVPNISRFNWSLFEHAQHFNSWGTSSLISPSWAFETTLAETAKVNEYPVRFAEVFSPDWEPDTSSLSSDYGTIPLVLNDAVVKNLRYFQEGIADRFQSYLDRFHHYKEVVEPIFQEFGLPTELMYLSLVESGFNPRAFSRARASGPWQFMKATGRMYKLNVSWYVDERRDPIKSTVAAAHHLRDLYDRFGSWPLALAAYNAGSGKVSRAIRKTGSRDFWKIRKTWHIRRETKDYVPRFIAATLIAKNPTAYGFLAPEGNQHEFEEVLVGKQVQLSAISDQTGIALEELKRLNPELRRNIIPNSNGPGYHLKVPVGMASLVAAQHETLPTWTQPPPPPTEWYQVRRGDSLSVVARRFGMKVHQLKNMNNLSSNLIRVGSKLRVRGGEEDEMDDQITWYRVRYGDSLGKIAARFRTSISQLKKLNKLSTHLIYPGDRLRVKGQPKSQQSQPSDSKWYRVQHGDSLWSIAQQFKVSVRDLRAFNNLTSSIIRAGHMLMVSQ